MKNMQRRIEKLEQRTPDWRTAKDMTDDELREIICQGTGLKPEELTDDKLNEIVREGMGQRYGLKPKEITDAKFNELLWKK
jgi:hypothetical protein